MMGLLGKQEIHSTPSCFKMSAMKSIPFMDAPVFARFRQRVEDRSGALLCAVDRRAATR
jgi:hypothetical protein